VDTSHRSLAEQILDASAWLAMHARRGKGRLWSYAIKHSVQRASGRYVSGAAVVAAAIAAGYRVIGQPTRRGNAWLSMRIVNRPKTVRDLQNVEIVPRRHYVAPFQRGR
jgi:hypothetical protein